MVLAWDRGELAGVAATVWNQCEYRIPAILLIRINDFHEPAHALIDNRDPPGVVAEIPPVDIVGIVVVDHHQPRPQLADRLGGDLCQQPVTAGILQTRIPIERPPTLPVSIDLGALPDR